MTECERIIEEGILPESFFAEEMRDDFLVTKELKKIWAVELDLFLEFKRVVEKYNLRYYAFGGTMLGAVRHNGFIPWDDDIDVAMPMEDYMKLQEIAKTEFHDPYQLQTPYLDPGSFFSFAKLRNSNTTFASKVFLAQTFNQGAFIDIFPLVECPPGKLKEQRDKIYPSIMKCSNYMKRGSESLMTKQQLERYNMYQTDSPLSEYLTIQKEFNNPDNKNCGYYTHASLFFDRDLYFVWERKLWEETVTGMFEKFAISLPNGWDEILKAYYGNYRQLPPKDKRVSLHSDMIIDMDRPYTDYIIE